MSFFFWFVLLLLAWRAFFQTSQWSNHCSCTEKNKNDEKQLVFFFATQCIVCFLSKLILMIVRALLAVTARLAMQTGVLQSLLLNFFIACLTVVRYQILHKINIVVTSAC